jgi:hypothetical protein
MTTTINRKINKKEEIISRAVKILTTHLTETNGIQKIKEIVCNNTSINRAEKSNKIFHIIFSPESIDALIQNMKLTGTAKSGIEIFKASKKISSFFSRKTTKTKTTMRRKTMTMTTSKSRSSDPIVSQVDIYLKPESIPIIERALESLMKSCLSADFVNVVQSQCIESIIKRVANGTNVENYFNGGGKFRKASASHVCLTRNRTRSRR